MAGFKEGRLGQKVLYTPEARATVGIAATDCIFIDQEATSAVDYINNSALLVAGATRIAMILFDQAVNK